MDPRTQIEREIDDIWDQETRGEISHSEAWQLTRNIERDYREEAEEAASQAYQNELDSW